MRVAFAYGDEDLPPSITREEADRLAASIVWDCAPEEMPVIFMRLLTWAHEARTKAALVDFLIAGAMTAFFDGEEFQFDTDDAALS